MRRHVLTIALLCLLGLAATTITVGSPQANAWGTIKGRVVWGGPDVPKREVLKITIDAGHCLQANPTANAGDGTILNENLVVNEKNKGLKNAFVYFLTEPDKKLPIHPNYQKMPPAVVIDQPACMFWPRALALREGQIFEVKNSAPVQHNIRWIGDGVVNQGGSVVIKPGDKHDIKDLKAQRLPLSVECNIHGWMKGRLLVCDHPYFAITDENGNFEIKDAPAGMHKLMIYHEEIGYRLGRKGKDGEDVTVKAGGTDLGELPMGK